MFRKSQFYPADRCAMWFRPVCPGVHQGAAAVRCPYCRHDETKVIDSRTSQDLSIRRRRECLSCERRFTTYERIEESPIRVIKKDGTRVPFDREKIRFGVEKACYKRPVSPEQIDALVGTVEATIYEDGEREVSSRRIGELVFNALRDLDKVAFVRFASVYREFQDVNDFVEELQPILDGRRRDPLH
ncbi:MAG: Transcriptional repressor NrdR [Planctomycetota bacterium]